MRMMWLDELPNDPAVSILLAGKLGVSVELAPQSTSSVIRESGPWATVYAASTKKLILFLFSQFTNELYYAIRVYNG